MPATGNTTLWLDLSWIHGGISVKLYSPNSTINSVTFDTRGYSPADSPSRYALRADLESWGSSRTPPIEPIVKGEGSCYASWRFALSYASGQSRIYFISYLNLIGMEEEEAAQLECNLMELKCLKTRTWILGLGL